MNLSLELRYTYRFESFEYTFLSTFNRDVHVGLEFVWSSGHGLDIHLESTYFFVNIYIVFFSCYLASANEAIAPYQLVPSPCILCYILPLPHAFPIFISVSKFFLPMWLGYPLFLFHLDAKERDRLRERLKTVYLYYNIFFLSVCPISHSLICWSLFCSFQESHICDFVISF